MNDLLRFGGSATVAAAFYSKFFLLTHICEQKACIRCSMFIDVHRQDYCFPERFGSVRFVSFRFDPNRCDSIRDRAFLRICLGVSYSFSMCYVHDFCANACLWVCEEGKTSSNIWIEYEENWIFVWANGFIFAH